MPDESPSTQPTSSTSDFILEKDETYVVLDDINNNLITIIEILAKNQEIQEKNQEILTDTQKIQKQILRELTHFK